MRYNHVHIGLYLLCKTDFPTADYHHAVFKINLITQQNLKILWTTIVSINQFTLFTQTRELILLNCCEVFSTKHSVSLYLNCPSATVGKKSLRLEAVCSKDYTVWTTTAQKKQRRLSGLYKLFYKL